ncbi:MAG: hypothetical protein DWQ40_13545 [Actinobacteria bacterium]|nr:MAG: hypothetical protein DWQ40_13545 [Actinomycetota bacterium]REK40378.1 MAG: hypothetical protein DWQ20_01980 [Actinomycetota bacterium]
MGHVPPGPVPEERQGPHLPRRQHRRGRPAGVADLGALGEALARRLLIDHGYEIIATNVAVGRGEIDIIARCSGERTVIEVRTVTGSRYPLDAVDREKRTQVRRLAARIGVSRCDLVGVGLHPGHYVIHWDKRSF